MLYGMDEDDEEEIDYGYDNGYDLIEKPHLNKMKVFFAVIILIAIVAIIISTITIVKTYNKPTEVETYSFSDKLDNDLSKKYDEDEKEEKVEEESSEETNNNEEQEEEEDDTLYRENAGNDFYLVTEEKSEEENAEEEVVEDSEPKSGVYNGMHMQLPEHNMERIKYSVVPKFIENSQEVVRNIYFSDEKQVYLTFDDGPSPDITPKVLDILKENDVPATFFVLGKCADRYSDLLKREYKEGHYIANHGYTHSYSQIYSSKDTVYEEFIKTENSIKNALGNQNYNSYLFRFPGGSSGGKYEKIKSEARELFESYGVAFTNWNCLTGDAEGSETPEDCVRRLKETMSSNCLIVLMHDANDKQQTVEALPTVIQYLKDEGYVFKNFYDIFK